MSQPEVSIGLIGHVDHGKTTLTEALSGKWADTHSEEMRRGITIRLGYADISTYKCSKCKGAKAYSTTAKCACGGKAEQLRTISFVDAPGHETLMATMLSGAAIIDGAILVIAANEPCPSPQTKEHMMALKVIGKENILVVQNKIDLIPKKEVIENYKQIKKFLKEHDIKAPVIPISAQKQINIDALVEAIEKNIPTPKRDTKSDPRMYIARSFDINKPGLGPNDLRGGVLGGSLVQGELKVGDELEICPGIKEGDKWTPVKSKIESLFAGGKPQKKVHPGGSIAIGTKLDPSLTKSDNLSGNVLGIPGKLPPIQGEFDLEVHLMERVVGLEKEVKVQPIKIGEPLMLAVGTTTTVGVISGSGKGKFHVRLKLPVCAVEKDRIVISRRIGQRWRFVGYGIIC